MTDKQLPDWALAQAFRECERQRNPDCSASLFISDLYDRARELSAQQPFPRDDELPGMWERADFMGGALDYDDQQPEAARVECTCPSGDGSLRWPCSHHLPELRATDDGKGADASRPEQAGGDRTIYDQRTAVDRALKMAAPKLYAALKNLLEAVRERPDLGIESVTLADADNALLAATNKPEDGEAQQTWIEATATLTTVEPAVVERFRIACRAWVRERVCYVEDVETLADVLRVLESVTQPPQSEQPARDGVKWPDYLMIRDTKLYDDMGGGGQRIYTTAGRGYEKVKYIRADIAQPPQPADGEAVGIAFVGVDGLYGASALPALGKNPPGEYKLYLHPTRGVEVTEALASVNSIRMHLESVGAHKDYLDHCDAIQAALSGVQR